MLSPSASSSAVTIPTPGKSILKRPQSQPQSFFSLARFSKLLPAQTQNANAGLDEANTLKRAHFILPELSTVYPILSSNPPSTPSLKEEKKLIEDREAERRRRIVRGNSFAPDSGGSDEWWSLDKVEAFYKECCRGREEELDPGISRAFKVRLLVFAQVSSCSYMTFDVTASGRHAPKNCRPLWGSAYTRVGIRIGRRFYYRVGVEEARV